MDPIITETKQGVSDIPEHGINTSGIVYQLSPEPYEYADAYWDEYQKRSTTEIGERIHNARLNLCEKFGSRTLLDVGIGSGQFLQMWNSLSNPNAPRACFGYDINKIAVKWMKDSRVFADPYKAGEIVGDGACCWDTLEHMHDPQAFLGLFKRGQKLFVSLPIYPRWKLLEGGLVNSKHFKPNEHVLYFTPEGLIWYLGMHHFHLLHFDRREIKAGREGVGSFVFEKG